jgi:excisionase family DNA binding protein
VEVGSVSVDRLPLGFPLMAHGMVVVTPEVATGLVALLEPGRRQLRANGMALHPGLRSTVAALEALAKMSRGEPMASTAAPVEWLSTDDAATRVGVSPEAVRKACATGRLQSVRVGRLIKVSAASVALWAEDRAA